MRCEAIGMWNDFIGSIPECDVDATIDENNQLTDMVLGQYEEIVDEYQIFLATNGAVTAPYPKIAIEGMRFGRY